MTIDLNNLKALPFTREFKRMLSESLESKLLSGDVVPLLPDRLDESASAGKKNKAEFMRTLNEYERDFADAADEDDKEIKQRGKQAIAMLKPLRQLDESKFDAGVPKQYTQFLDNMFSYVCFMSDKLPTLKEDVDLSISSTFIDELCEGLESDVAYYLSEHVRSDAIEIDWSMLGPEEKDLVIKLKELGRQCGSDPGAYASGVLRLTFKNKQAVIDYTDRLESEDMVDAVEIEAYREDMVAGYVEEEEYDFDNIMFDKDFEFDVYVYLVPEIVSEDPFDMDIEGEFDFDAENAEYISEVRRRIKVNFRGKKRIKMQCRPGFKWVAAKKTCVKITGSEVALKRKAMRRMVRTKKAKGASFKVRVLRKTRKAKRFRKSMGLGPR